MRLKNADIELLDDNLLIRFHGAVKAISNAVMGYGLNNRDTILIHKVPLSYDHKDPEMLLKRVCRQIGLDPERVIGFMTAADITRFVAKEFDYGFIIVTAGVRNIIAAGYDYVHSPIRPSTINTILSISIPLSDRAMVEAIEMITIAKAYALLELGLNSPISGIPALMTSTDAMAVVSCQSGKKEKVEYLGPATRLGFLISRETRKAIRKAIMNSDIQIGIRHRLISQGVSIEKLLDLIGELHIPHPGVETREKFIAMAREELEEIFKDINVILLIEAILGVHESIKLGRINMLPPKEAQRDPVYVVADEILGIALALYIAGIPGLFEYYRFDREKPGFIKKLELFLDDLVASLAGGISSRVYTRALRELRNR